MQASVRQGPGRREGGAGAGTGEWLSKQGRGWGKAHPGGRCTAGRLTRLVLEEQDGQAGQKTEEEKDHQGQEALLNLRPLCPAALGTPWPTEVHLGEKTGGRCQALPGHRSPTEQQPATPHAGAWRAFPGPLASCSSQSPSAIGGVLCPWRGLKRQARVAEDPHHPVCKRPQHATRWRWKGCQSPLPTSAEKEKPPYEGGRASAEGKGAQNGWGWVGRWREGLCPLLLSLSQSCLLQKRERARAAWRETQGSGSRRNNGLGRLRDTSSCWQEGRPHFCFGLARILSLCPLAYRFWDAQVFPQGNSDPVCFALAKAGCGAIFGEAEKQDFS